MARRFVTAAPEGARAPIHFEVEGPYLDEDADGNVTVRHADDTTVATYVETFRARRVMPPGALLDLATLLVVDPKTGERSYNVPAIQNFMMTVLLNDDERQRWNDLIRDNTRAIEITQLAEIVAFLAEEITNRPTSP